MSRLIKFPLSSLLAAAYAITAGLRRNWSRLRNHAELSSQLAFPLDSSVVVLGPVEVHGTGQVRIGKDVLIYPGLYLETEEAGSIEIGDGVVLSRGVHLASRMAIAIGRGSMIGEYTSIRDANHSRTGDTPIRESGHSAEPIRIGDEVWIGRGVAVLPGTEIGTQATVGANAVVTHNVAPRTTVVGVPAREVASRELVRPL